MSAPPVLPSRRAVLRAGLATGAATLVTPGDAQACAPELILPQDDPRSARRLAELETMRELYAYSYDKPNIRGVAMCEELPPGEGPARAWIRDAAALLSEIRANDAVTNEAVQDEPGSLLMRLCRAGTDAGGLVFGTLADLVSPEASEAGARSLDEYRAHFGLFPLPKVAETFASDETFARMRVAGPNPAWIRRVQGALPEDFGVDETHARAALGEVDSLEAAQGEGRLFLCAYPELVDVEMGAYPVPPPPELSNHASTATIDAAYADRAARYAQSGRPKTRVAPYALFARPRGGRSLVPVAIQLLPNGHAGQSYPVLTPADGSAWTVAKAMVAAADGTVHETMSHLGRTHLVLEAFGLSLMNNLARHHPIHALLAPHLEGTFLINRGADLSLVAPGGVVDEVLLTSVGGSVALSGRALAALDYGASAFPNDLAARGLDDPEALPDYPFRDDGLLVWSAIEGWVRAFVERYYRDDATVVADPELQSFVRELGQHKVERGGRLVGGNLRGVGQGGALAGRDALTRLVTQVIFDASALHAAVNFPQRELMSFTPAAPLACYGPLPRPGEPAELLACLPPLSAARAQLGTCTLLGGLRHTRLGDYGRGVFGDQEVRAALSRFQSALASAEATILDRNSARPDYPYLRPSLLPQSINI